MQTLGDSPGLAALLRKASQSQTSKVLAIISLDVHLLAQLIVPIIISSNNLISHCKYSSYIVLVLFVSILGRFWNKKINCYKMVQYLKN